MHEYAVRPCGVQVPFVKAAFGLDHVLPGWVGS